MTLTNSPPSQAPAYRLAALLLSMGTLHFVTPKPFDALVPTELPGKRRHYTYVSGVAELTVGLALTHPKTRKLGATAAAAMFVAIFPGNLNLARLWWHKPAPMRAVALIRLPAQIPLITHALKARRNAP